MQQPRRAVYWALGLSIFALILHLFLLRFTFDGPGDGPSRMLIAYIWSLHPKVIASDYYLPGYVYLNGLASYVFSNPLFTARIVSSIFGALTVGVMFLLARTLFSNTVAILVGVSTLFLPMHLALSLSSLAEPDSIFFLLASMLFLIQSAEAFAPNSADAGNKSTRWLMLASCAVTFFIASTLRGEAWTYVPLWLFYFLLRTRNIKVTALLACAFASFPIYWMVSCAQDIGQPFISMSAYAEGSTERVTRVSVFEALLLCAKILCKYAGPVVPLAASVGFWQTCRSAFAKQLGKIDLEKAFYCLMCVQAFLICVGGAQHWGKQVQSRYFCTLMLLMLPLAVSAITSIPWFASRFVSGIKAKSFIASLIASLLIINSMLATVLLTRPYLFITNTKWTELYELADWLDKQGLSDKNVVCTSLLFRAFFIPLVNKKLADHTDIVMHYWTPYKDLADRLDKHRPDLLILGYDDGEDLSELLNVVHFKLEEKPIWSKNYLSVYRVVPNTFEKVSQPKLARCFWYPQPSWRTFYKTVERSPHYWWN